MSSVSPFLLAGAFLIVCGLYHFVVLESIFRKLLALNILGTGVFMIMISLAARSSTSVPDPVPHAMVLTGIVVSLCGTAVGLKLLCRLHALTGHDRLLPSPKDSDAGH